MFVAAVYQQSSEGLWNMMPALGILWVCLGGIALGSTRFGIDYLLTKTKKSLLSDKNLKAGFLTQDFPLYCNLVLRTKIT
jgi:putative oxidoreductase